jgi:tetratricopeptide (TPR) repeat protein
VETGYPASEVARTLGISARRVRSFLAAGLLEPRREGDGEARFTFQDLVILRTAEGLLAAGIPLPRVKSALARLRRQLPRGSSLAAVRITAEAGQVVAHDGREAWEPESGQRQLPFGDLAEFQGFAVADLAARAAPLARRLLDKAHRRGDLEAEDWYELGYELEATAVDDARGAYERALVLDPGHADARLNLGRLLHAAGDAAGAEAQYRRAAAERPRDPTARFNLGVALQDLGRQPEAVEAYRAALQLDPGFADAHFNLAGLYAQLGDRARALQSLKAYRSLLRG